LEKSLNICEDENKFLKERLEKQSNKINLLNQIIKIIVTEPKEIDKIRKINDKELTQLLNSLGSTEKVLQILFGENLFSKYPKAYHCEENKEIAISEKISYDKNEESLFSKFQNVQSEVNILSQELFSSNSIINFDIIFSISQNIISSFKEMCNYNFLILKKIITEKGIFSSLNSLFELFIDHPLLYKGNKYYGLTFGKKPENVGMLESSDGSQGLFTFVDGEINGFGILLKENEYIYFGYFGNGLYNGFGIWISLNQISTDKCFFGYWIEGKRSGNGICLTLSGQTFFGTWVNDQMKGKFHITSKEGIQETKIFT